jgi:hypothetical protein
MTEVNMTSSEFSRFADELIREMGPQLPDLGRDFVGKQGKGIIQFELHDAERPEDRTSAISYFPLDKLPVGSHPRQLAAEYDPMREVVLQIIFDRMVLTRCLQFSDLKRGS